MKRFLALLVSMMVLLNGCGPSVSKEGAKKPLDLKKENERLKSQLVLLKKENESLKQELEELKKESRALVTSEMQQGESQEKQKPVNALANMETSEDRVEGLTLYEDKTTKELSDKSAFYLYIEKREHEDPRLFLKIRYAGKDWLFIESFIIKAGAERFTLLPVNLQRRAIGGGIVIESDARPVTAEIYEIIKAVIPFGEAVIRYNGKNTYKDRTITDEEKTALQNVLDAYKALGGRFPSP